MQNESAARLLRAALDARQQPEPDDDTPTERKPDYAQGAGNTDRPAETFNSALNRNSGDLVAAMTEHLNRYGDTSVALNHQAR